MAQNQGNAITTDKNAKFNVKVVYCGGWGYTGKFNQVKQVILNYYPNAHIEGEKTPSKSGAFEIYVEEKLIFSKLKSNSFVQDYNKLIQDIKNLVEA